MKIMSNQKNVFTQKLRCKTSRETIKKLQFVKEVKKNKTNCNIKVAHLLKEV